MCTKLDSLPLAIELAAARLKLFGPDALLERLETTLPLLTEGSRDAPERQRTLRATIEWSYELLDEASRQLLARLAVFAGSFPLGAAESVCDAGLPELAALVDMSLLKSIGGDRLLMLETIREYALERLAESGEEDAIRRRHASEFTRLAESAYGRRLDEEAESSARLDRDHDDLRFALDWLEGSDPDTALELAGALGWFWFTHGYLVEGDARLDAALAASSVGGRTRARALAAAGSLAARIGRAEDGREKLEGAVARWRELGDRSETAAALDALGWMLFYDANDDEASLAAFEDEREIWRELGDESGEIRGRVGVCQVLVAMREVERAETLSEDLLERAPNDLRVKHFAIHFLADCSLIRDDCDEAEESYRESLRAALELGDVIETSIEVQGLAMAKAGRGESARALELTSSVEALWRSLGADLHVAFWDELLEHYLGAAQGALGPEEADAARRRGLELPFDDAVALALQGDLPSPRPSPDVGRHALVQQTTTGREHSRSLAQASVTCLAAGVPVHDRFVVVPIQGHSWRSSSRTCGSSPSRSRWRELAMSPFSLLTQLLRGSRAPRLVTRRTCASVGAPLGTLAQPSAWRLAVIRSLRSPIAPGWTGTQPASRMDAYDRGSGS